MSVPVNLRNVPDSETNAKSEVLEKCSKLFYHAVQCCQSSKVQSTVFAFLANGIVQESLEIYLDAYGANSEPYYKGKITEENYNTRKRLILEAMRKCSNLQGLVTLGKRCFKWRNKKIIYWVNFVRETRELLTKWLNWCEKEYKIQRG